MGKYDRLNDYLSNRVEIKLSYEEIEEIIGSELPLSARDRYWWGNTRTHTRVQAHSWLNAGWKVKDVLADGIIFIRAASN